MRRGLWLGEYITVHGPHDAPADRFWGEAEASLERDGDLFDVHFYSDRKIRNIYDVRNVRIFDGSASERRNTEDRAAFPILKPSELTPKARRWLKTAQHLKKKYHEEYLESNRIFREQKALHQKATSGR
jgi:hypothetical protein